MFTNSQYAHLGYVLVSNFVNCDQLNSYSDVLFIRRFSKCGTYIHNFNSMLTSLWAGCLKDGRYKVVLSLSPMPESISTFHLEMKAAFSEF